MMQNSDEQKNGRDFEDQIAARQQYTLYENSTYMVVSKIAYLIGVPQTIFENEHEPPQMEWYLELEKDKPGSFGIFVSSAPRSSEIFGASVRRCGMT